MSQPLEYIDSWYQATSHVVPQQPELTEDITADVCIIGGGMTGFNAAIELRKKGYEVALLEAGRLSWGASGRNGGMCLVGYCLGLHDVDAEFGPEWGKQLWDLSCEALDVVRERIAEFNINCDFQPGCIEVGLNKDQIEELEAYKRLMDGHYAYTSAEWWDAKKIQEVTTADRYLGGLYDTNSAHIHPLNYTLGLAKAAIDLGVKVYEHSRAIKVVKGSPNQIRTAKGSVKAKQVLLACNAYIDGLFKKAENKTLPVVSYMAVTEQLGDRQPISNKMAMSDLNSSLDYFRPTADGRILFGGVNHPLNGEYKDSMERCRQRMVKVFPQLDDVKMEYHWGGLFAVTREYMPQIEHLGNDIYAAHGYTGHGVSLTNIAGRVVAEAMAGNAERFDVFSRIKHKWIPTPKVLRKPALAMAIWKAELEDALAS
ncbi:NAD(P)/FAD-dependent oxidoreductase [Parendozoicomonas haliclonae]|uniref:Gamma-glutamylputrescine oxidoreductase n=1 Tax=Parendozoicomonas haliclonae TaxID=1960125 RepID=A0A1X7AEP2_9GAMM|nr:FAD-binding oxidoreductase [Parendozoicomonas haliclonae]SMA35221.1 Gamma-glutamylputrescine oxidoreductase [Parendozoicomonas haliclonae]